MFPSPSLTESLNAWWHFGSTMSGHPRAPVFFCEKQVGPSERKPLPRVEHFVSPAKITLTQTWIRRQNTWRYESVECFQQNHASISEISPGSTAVLTLRYHCYLIHQLRSWIWVLSWRSSQGRRVTCLLRKPLSIKALIACLPMNQLTGASRHKTQAGRPQVVFQFLLRDVQELVMTLRGQLPWPETRRHVPSYLSEMKLFVRIRVERSLSKCFLCFVCLSTLL